jgi:putative endonuclease
MLILTVYILECKDGTYYTGVTNDIDRRMAEHNEGHNPSAFTYRKRPVTLVFTYDCIDGHEAYAFEKQIKGWRREKKKALIEGRWDDLPELSKAYMNKQGAR